ncbi:HK97-gp10 family putative phage morphogenesis protein [Paramaledivibacter caminithermalis]|jgi:HK97 gp10 family phage protein|uniref:Phage protein, HK97 gp10 family n=1 Tax=Paramaledivibacter caminithermalis (strain DSM 15212 / CIP 107654 / DViRD3) TaxID=1121301 RepID=A0A1M6SW90_PARC5|nr:HK97-gp10 family putative phage morphogenesis protein [Paramaledivibacter caminithermalis]SHK48929.1 phage protein, HK97 gp10 family [Paramaledivibacter caminithermalis DSM 15212]
MANRGFYIELENVERTIREIGLFQIEKRENVKKIIKKTAKRVVKEAKARVPVDTGETKKSIKAKYLEGGLMATVKPRLPGGWKAHFHEYGTVKMRARPFMGPAEEVSRNDYLQEMRSEVNR